jgi:Skp family chaperone for outer membrane proteins
MRLKDKPTHEEGHMKRFLVVPVMMLLGAAPAFAQSDVPAAAAAAPAAMTPELHQKLEAVRARFMPQVKPIAEDAFATRKALRDEVQKAQPDDGTLTRLEDRLASDRQQLESLRAQKQAELKRELTPQQYAQLMLRHGHFGHRMHGGER